MTPVLLTGAKILYACHSVTISEAYYLAAYFLDAKSTAASFILLLSQSTFFSVVKLCSNRTKI